MANILVTGASRGLGLEWVRQCAGRGWRVFATCREPFEAGLLRPGQPTRDVYLAVLTRQPLSDTTVHQLREGRGLVVGEDSYQLDNLFRVLDRADARTASLLVTTLPL